MQLFTLLPTCCLIEGFACICSETLTISTLCCNYGLLWLFASSFPLCWGLFCLHCYRHTVKGFPVMLLDSFHVLLLKHCYLTSDTRSINNNY